MSELRRTPRTQRFRSRFTVALVVGALSGIVAVGALAQVASKSALIGKLEGPAVVTDAAQFPKAFKEAPMLAELVKAGKLPPVEQRVGQEPLVIKPLHEIGKYGGTWRRGFTGPADGGNGNRCCSRPRPPAVLGLHRRQGRPERRQGLGGAGRRPDAHRCTCAGA